MRRANWLLLIALMIVGATLYFGCSQPDDILTPVSTTSLKLSAQMLPPAPQGMIYELWIVKDSNFVSLGTFNYDLVNRKFLDESGEIRADSNEFILDGDIFSYDSVYVSVETVPDNDSLIPGPIMLTDQVTNPNDNLIELIFPWSSDSLWYATCRYNLQTMSDYDRTENTGAGLWLSSYQMVERALQDTIAFDSFTIDPIWIYDIGAKTETTVVVDIINPRIDTSNLILGLDTVEHIGFLFEDSTETFTKPADSFLTTEVKFFLQYGPLDTVYYDLFTQDDFGLPDYSSFGWHYKTWIVAPVVKTEGASEGDFTLPAWGYTQIGLDRLPGYDGGMISTGTFTKIDEPDDDGARYAQSLRVPPFPGDEFFVDLPNGVSGPLNLLPNSYGNEGTVFIALEPDNFVTDTTNFPLIPFAWELLSSQEVISDSTATLFNLTHTNDPYWGFPKITVDIQRY
ncbi:MAG: hypothetical protein DRP47_07875 [Candidatus Zixiibacteriota bacterium]|nr:MAG: hypothetical protein DRP47_07875 [candidate division Zixibacteria bacterium]